MSVKKEKKSIALSPTVIDLVDNYAALNKVSFSAAAENLLLTAFENIDTIKEVLEIQKTENARLRKELKLANERSIAFSEEILRYTAMAYGYGKTAALYTHDSDFVKRMNDKEFQKTQEGGMIKAAFKSLRNQKERKEEAAFYEEV